MNLIEDDEARMSGHCRRAQELESTQTHIHRDKDTLTLIDEECLDNWGRIGEARRLNDNSIKLVHPLVKPLECLHKVTPNSAADAPVHHLNHLLIDCLRDDLLVDANFTEFILDDGKFHAMSLIIEDVIEEGCLARAEKAC